MGKFKVFIFNTLTSVISALVFRFAFLWLNIFISNKAGAENMGVYSLTMSVYMVLIAVAASGLNLASCRITAEELACGRERSAIKNTCNCMTFGLICSFVATLIVFVFCKPISEIILHGKVSVFTVKCLCISLPFISVSSVISGYLNALRKAYKVSCVQFLESFFEIISSVCLFIFIPPKNANSVCFYLILSNAVSKILSFVIYISLFIAETCKPKSVHQGKNTLKRMFKIVIPVAVSSHIKSALSGLKHTLVPVSLEKYTKNCNSALGEYGKINAMAMPIITFPCCFFSAVASLLVPEISSLCVLKKSEKISLILSKTYKITMIVSVFTISIAYFYGSDIGMLFYKNKSIGKYIMYLAPVMPFIYFDCIVDAVLKGIDKQVQVVLINITDTLICILLICFLLPATGTYGYIAVIYISEFFNGIASTLTLRKKIKFKTDTANSIIKPAVSAIISAYVINLSEFNTYLSFGLFTLSYICLLFLFNVIRKDEIRILRM